jgi:hypothetical protein
MIKLNGRHQDLRLAISLIHEFFPKAEIIFLPDINLKYLAIDSKFIIHNIDNLTSHLENIKGGFGDG